MEERRKKMVTDVHKLAEIYRFRGEHEVTSFLEKHEYLTPLLRQAHDRIKQLFGEQTCVVLEVFHDPDAGEGEAELFALIQTKLPAQEARKLRSRLDQEWWFETSARSDFRLNIDVEYA